ncbi:MAG TPA: hypothetical protein VEI57_01370 [Nitrospirota bacterium]|nr:hypothetical protein [Nitrospirota bacterium]
MRITSSILYSQILNGLQNFQATDSELTNELSTGKKILKPSDDVAGTMRAMDYQVSIRNNNQFENNINDATTNLNLTSNVLTGVSSTLSALTNLISSSSSTTTVDSATLANQASQLRNELYNYSNTKNGSDYLFSGFLTNQQPYTIQNQPVGTVPSTAYVYNGDDGALNIPIGSGKTMQANVTGNDAFSLAQGALPASVTLSNGQIAEYSAGAGTAVNVTILHSDGVTVADSFSFSNVMDMANIVSSALSTDDTSRIEAMTEPLSDMQNQVNALQSDVGSRINALKDQTSLLTQNTTTLQNQQSTVEDADTNQLALQLSQTSTALQALESTASQILTQSLFNFLSSTATG